MDASSAGSCQGVCFPNIDLSTHPCYSRAAHFRFGRIHVPVAPRCNIQCNYCIRRYACPNENRPGVTMRVASPDEALQTVRHAVARDPRLRVLGVAGPGDALANSATLTTFERAYDEFPHLIRCLSTNGLLLPDQIDAIEQAGITTLTITINAVDPAIAEQIYAHVRYRGKTYRGREACTLLLRNQLTGLREAALRGMAVKVNSVLIPGVNDHHLIDVARTVKDHGAYYNIKNDIRTFEYLFEAPGLRIIARFTGNVSVDDLKIMHKAALNIVHCQRSATYIADMTKEKYGTPYINVTLWGIKNMAKALRDTAAFFGLEARAEEVIARETARIQPYIDAYRQHLQGKRVFIYQGGPRVWHWIELLRELGMETETAATTFGHMDDYEKIFNQIAEGALVIDNPNVPEIEEILTRRRPDLFISGNKERYLAYKMGVPFVNGHTYDTGPYAGFVGMVNFARDIDKALHAPVWNIVHQHARPAPAARHAVHGSEEVES